MGEEEISDGMHCINHPHRKNPAGTGICAFCLQEKLCKLVSSSFHLPITASSPSPPRSVNITIPTPSSLPPKNNPTTKRLPFLLPKKKNNKKPSSINTSDAVLKRSKSTVTPRRTDFIHDNEDFRKRKGFWSFLYPSSKPSVSCSKKLEANSNPRISTVMKQRVSSEEEEEESCGDNLDQRRVSRSRSVGCGSRSFSGDLFERISTGLGDCALRRVESHREGNKVISGGNMYCMKERVRCGGIFGGFMMMTSNSTSSSSSSSHWVSSDGGVNGEKGGRNSNSSSSWGWALASPIRAFTNKKRDASSSQNNNNNNNNSTPNLSAVPSLLTVTT